jgi:hypothetical protein
LIIKLASLLRRRASLYCPSALSAGRIEVHGAMLLKAYLPRTHSYTPRILGKAEETVLCLFLF